MAKKDRVKPLLAILADGDAVRIRKESARYIREIQQEVAALNKDAKLIRELVDRFGGATDSLTSRERSTKISEAAVALAESGQRVLTPQDVLDYLKDREGITFGVGKPASVAGTVLSRMEEFERLKRNQFRYVGNSHKNSEQEP
jgi:hypothetical protein